MDYHPAGCEYRPARIAKNSYLKQGSDFRIPPLECPHHILRRSGGDPRSAVLGRPLVSRERDESGDVDLRPFGNWVRHQVLCASQGINAR